MSLSMDTEPFPELTPVNSLNVSTNGTVHRRRKSSNLNPRGDTGAPGLSTLYSPPTSPSTGDNIPEIHDKPSKRSKRRKVKSLFRKWKDISLRHTWLNPLIICVAVLTGFLIRPTPDNPFRAALFISYPLPRDLKAGPDDPIKYGKGGKDFVFVAFYTIFLSFTREFVMQRILRPWAIYLGFKSRSKQARFMEQAYTAMYFSVLGPLGLYVMSQTDIWYFNINAMYEGFPHKSHIGIFKAYYLVQAAYWSQQMIVLLLGLEKPRKDFKELVAHHFITIALIWCSYRFHFTHMGLAVYLTHDVSDFFLATSKVLNYMDSPIVVPFFAIFINVWFYCRHYQNLRILASMIPLPLPFPEFINEHIRGSYIHVMIILRNASTPIISSFARLLPGVHNKLVDINSHLPISNPFEGTSPFESVGSYALDWAAQQYKCWISHWITFSLIAALQAINIFWFFFICRILVRVVTSMGQDKRDDRSELDSDEEAELKAELEEWKNNEVIAQTAKLAAEKTKAAQNGKVKSKK